jgi:DNA (cytosine-5)-methyltransferase 1
MLKIGSLCSGYGGLDMAVEAYFNAETVWMCDNDKYASVVIKERWNLPNLGDLKAVDWTTVEPIDILTAGYPCQPFSTAGHRKGEKDERHIWPEIKTIISNLQPKFAILENVRGHLTLGFKEVLQDLTAIGYDAKWAIVRASDAGAPHQRARLFIFAWNTNNSFDRPFCGLSQECCTKSTGISRANETLQCSYANSIRSNLGRQGEKWNQRQSQFEFGQMGSVVANTASKGFQGSVNEGNIYAKCSDIWDRQVPHPLAQNKLNPKFVEYMMGLPEGWVTDLDISRSQQLKILGNGVVPQQAYYALQLLCDTPIVKREEQMNLTEALCLACQQA